jgi:hypothetical protein
MTLFFKLIAIFLLLSSYTNAEGNEQKILVEVNFFHWENTNTAETFENLEEFRVLDPFVDLGKIEIKNFQSNLKENLDKIENVSFLHSAAWKQQIEELETSKFIKITSYNENCFIKVYKSRFLRLVVKCASRDGFIINRSTKAEAGGTYYFDHPMFGILISLQK